METEHGKLPPPPGLIASLAAGFDSVANSITVIALPVLFDLFLWFGPHMSLRELIQPLLQQLPNLYSNITSAANMEAAQEFWNDLAGRFNLFSGLRTFPVGTSSLLTFEMPIQTPVGSPPVFEAGSIFGILGWAALAVLTGWLIGALYYYWVSKVSLRPESLPLDVSRVVPREPHRRVAVADVERARRLFRALCKRARRAYDDIVSVEFYRLDGLGVQHKIFLKMLFYARKPLHPRWTDVRAFKLRPEVAVIHYRGVNRRVREHPVQDRHHALRPSPLIEVVVDYGYLWQMTHQTRCRNPADFKQKTRILVGYFNTNQREKERCLMGGTLCVRLNNKGLSKQNKNRI